MRPDADLALLSPVFRVARTGEGGTGQEGDGVPADPAHVHTDGEEDIEEELDDELLPLP